jgi:uncharacterized phiE125 gp8 family phage protein
MQYYPQQQRNTYKVTTAPASEPITLADAKTYLNVSTSLHNALITSIISSARVYYEFFTETAVISQTVTEVWDWTPAEFELTVSPVVSAVVSYKDENGSYQTWNASNYTLATNATLARIVKNPSGVFPSTGDFPERWKVVYVAGYTNADAVPQDIISAIKLWIAFLYENREDIPINDTNNYKIRSFAAIAHRRRIHLI